MDFLKAVNIIGRDLEEAMALLEQLSGVSGSDLAEIELARSRVRSAADLVRLLPTMSNANAVKAEITSRRFEEPVKAEKNNPAPAEIKPAEAMASVTGQADAEAAAYRPAEAKAAMTIPSEAEAPRVRPAEAKTAMIPPAEAEVTRVRPAEAKAAMNTPAEADVTGAEPVIPAPAAQKNPEPSKAIFADRFIAGDTIGEKISTGKKEEDVSSVIKSKPISDIASAIGINDRFYFIRELFSGDALAYGDTIKRLNAASSLGEAMKILDESTVMGSDPAAQSSFVDVVRRKFSLNV